MIIMKGFIYIALFLLSLISLTLSLVASSSLSLLELSINEIYSSLNTKDIGVIQEKKDILTFEAKSIYLSIPNCKLKTIESYKNISYTDCKVIAVIGALSSSSLIINSNYDIPLDSFLIEFLFEHISFEENNGKLKVKMALDSININKKQSLFSSMTMLASFNDLISTIGKDLAEIYIMTIGNEAGMFKDSSHMLGDINGVLNVLSMGGPYYYKDIGKEEDMPEQITFYSFKPAEISESLSLKNKIVISMISVPFEYSIDCDLNYKEGLITLSHVIMTIEWIRWKEVRVDLDKKDKDCEYKMAKEYIVKELNVRLMEALEGYRKRIYEANLPIL